MIKLRFIRVMMQSHRIYYKGVWGMCGYRNVAPQAMSRLCALAMSASTEEQQQEVRRLNDLLMPLNNDLFVEANPIPVKWALSMGLIGLGIRLPLTPLAELYHQRIEAALEVAGVNADMQASN